MSEKFYRLRPYAPFGIALALILSLGALGVAYFLFFGLCAENCIGRNWQLKVQLAVAVVIVLVAIGMVFSAILESWTALIILAFLTFGLYLGWVLLLLDAGQVSAH